MARAGHSVKVTFEQLYKGSEEMSPVNMEGKSTAGSAKVPRKVILGILKEIDVPEQTELKGDQ